MLSDPEFPKDRIMISSLNRLNYKFNTNVKVNVDDNNDENNSINEN